MLAIRASPNATMSCFEARMATFASSSIFVSFNTQLGSKVQVVSLNRKQASQVHTGELCPMVHRTQWLQLFNISCIFCKSERKEKERKETSYVYTVVYWYTYYLLPVNLHHLSSTLNVLPPATPPKQLTVKHNLHRWKKNESRRMYNNFGT